MRSRSVTYSQQAAFSAIADPTRRAELDLLRRGSLPAGQIASAFSVSRPAVSKHLRLLLRARLVQERREGRHRFYQLNPGPLRAVDSWLNEYRIFWQANLGSLKSFVETEHAQKISRVQNPWRRANSHLMTMQSLQKFRSQLRRKACLMRW